MEVNPAENTEAPVVDQAVTKEIDETEESTPVVPSEEETGAGDAPAPATETVDSTEAAPVVAAAETPAEEPVANGNGEAETAETKEPESAEESLKRKTDEEGEEATTEVPEKRLKTADAEEKKEAAVVEDGENAEEATA